MYSRNTSTGALTALSTPTIATGTTPRSITISSDGTSVYATNYGSNTISMYSRSTSFATGVFTQPRTGMQPSTLYYYRGYATNIVGTGYSPGGTFTTLP